MDKEQVKAFYDLLNNSDFQIFLNFLNKRKEDLIELLISSNDDEVRGKIKMINELLYIFNKENINNIYTKMLHQNTYYV